MGPKAGAGFGLLWGLTSLIRAYAAPNSLVTILLFQNPVICLLPRVLAGYLAGLIILPFKKQAKTDKGLIAGYTLSGLTASIANTLLVILLSAVFYWNDPGKLLGARPKRIKQVVADRFADGAWGQWDSGSPLQRNRDADCRRAA